MRIAIAAPSPVPFTQGGAENLWLGWLGAMNARADVEADLIKLPTPEGDFWSIVASYERFARLDLNHFDRVISTKYPAWMVAHRDHHVFLQHKLRGLYDTWPSAMDTAMPAVTSPELSRVLTALAEARGARSALPDIFGSLTELRARADSQPNSLFALPGPLIRQVVHCLDDIGLSRHAIRRYAAISATVRARAHYFPADVAVEREVEVLHHPTLPRDIAPVAPIPDGAIFTASRLDGPKRIDWLIKAHQQAGIAAPLYIAGDGPQRARLEALAAKAPGVTLLGRLGDEELAAAYRAAAFIAYVPDREDYGLITLEALQAGRPVLTCSDTGGVTELVCDGYNGLITEPTIKALAVGMQRLAGDNAFLESLADNASESVGHIRWSTLVDAFARPRAKIAVINTFSFYPAVNGGQRRMFYLYSELARYADVVCVNLVQGGPQRERQLTPGLTEQLVPMSREHLLYAQELQQRLNASCDDIATLLRPELTPAWIETVAAACQDAALVVLPHHYGWTAVRACAPAITVYDAFNVEADLKAAIIGESAPELAQVRELEGECARRASRVFCCSAENAERMQSLYALPDTPGVIANGVDVYNYHPMGQAERADARQRLGLGTTPVAIFVGSLHGPNIEAALHIVDIAHDCPETLFCLLGSVCEADALRKPARGKGLPGNVQLIGRVSESELRVWLAIADAGLNPVTSGSGTNLKMLEYAAAGLPVISTPFGGRGGILEAPEHYIAAEVAEFPAALKQLLEEDPLARQTRADVACQRAREAGDWRQLASKLWQGLQELLCS